MALIYIDEHRNIAVDPTQVASVTVDAERAIVPIAVTMRNGEVHRLNRFYRQSEYATHSIVVAKINEALA